MSPLTHRHVNNLICRLPCHVENCISTHCTKRVQRHENKANRRFTLLNSVQTINKIRHGRAESQLTAKARASEPPRQTARRWRRDGALSYIFAAGAGEANRVQKRKAAIAVPSLDRLPSVIDTLIAAVPKGELDP
jgi:hypothetical protein